MRLLDVNKPFKPLFFKLVFSNFATHRNFLKKNEEIQLYTCMEKLNYTF